MKQFIRNTLGALLLAFVMTVGGGVISDAHAASGGLTISPTSVDVEVAPGESYSGNMLVINQGEIDVTYKVYATPYSVNGEDYQPYFSPIPGAIDITKWFSFGNSGNTIKVGNQDTIPYTITVPKGTGAGGYYATVFAETTDKGSTGVITHKRVGMVVYLKVSGNAIEAGKVDTWSVPWLQQSPLSADLKLANSGSVHYQAKVTVTVSDLFGSQKFSYERDPEILPQKLRSIPISWENGATYGLFKVGGEVSYLNKTEQLPAKYVFIASIPMRILTIAILLAFVIVVVLGSKRVASRKK